MRFVSYKSFFLSFIFFALVIIFISKCKNGYNTSDPNTLALVDKKLIDKNIFIKRYKDFRLRTGSPDNGLARRSILNTLVSEELLILEARRRGYENDVIGKQEMERLKIQELLNAYHHLFIKTPVSTTEEELKQLYINLNTKIKARHIYAPTKKKADSLYTILNQGINFEEVAKSCFKDPALKESGGSLGYFSIDEMEPAFEEAAFVLKIGELSKPVKTTDGYSIIRVDDRISKPLLTEEEFSKHRSKLERYWLKRKIHKATQEHSDSLRKVLNITFNDQVVGLLFKLLRTNEQNLDEALEVTQKEQPDIENEDLLYSELGTWTVKKFREHAKFTSQNQRDWIRDELKLKEFIAGLVQRAFLLKKARELKMHKTQEYKRKVAEQFDTWLLERVEKDVNKEFVIPEDSLKKYFDEDPDIFAEPARIRLKEIVLYGDEKVKKITSSLKDGISFSTLALKHSVNKESAEKGGDLGFLDAQHLGPRAKEILAMNIGDWAGPFEMNSYIVFLKCVDKLPAQLRNYAQARLEVEETVRSLWQDRIREDKVTEIKVTKTVASFPEKLRTIKIN
jgi:parvulin-like peptidyl-prolyl isomerase